MEISKILFAVCICLTTAIGERANAQVDAFLTSDHSPLRLSLVPDYGTDPNPPTKLISVSSPSHGTAKIDGRAVVYTPSADFPGLEEFTYTLEDREGNSTTAAMRVADAQMAVRGTFVGSVFYSDGSSSQANDSRVGSIRVTVSRGASFTATLTVNGKRSTLLGRLESDGTFSRPGPFNLSISPFTGSLTGSFESRLVPGTESTFSGFYLSGRRAFSAANPCPDAGSYNFAIISLDVSGQPPSPRFGDGYGRMFVSKLGGVQLIGYLGDTGALSLTGSIIGNVCPLAGPVRYAGYYDGSCSGQLFFGSSGFTGFSWKRTMRLVKSPPYVKARAYTANGLISYSRYVPASPSLPLIAGPNNMMVGFEQGYNQVIYQDMTWSADNTIKTTATATLAGKPPVPLTIRVNPNTGVFSGTFRDPLYHEVCIVGGVIMQNQANGTGFFHGPTVLGGITLYPATAPSP